MNDYLLDTHIFIWLVDGNKKLTPKHRTLINNALIKSNVYINAISCWEIAMLVEKKRMILSSPTINWIEQALKATGIQLYPLSPQIAIESCQLPNVINHDPADRIIIANARVADLTLITKDKVIQKYSKRHHVKTI